MMLVFVCQDHSKLRAAKNITDFSSIQLSMYIISQFSVSNEEKKIKKKNGQNEKRPHDVILLRLWNCYDGIISII